MPAATASGANPTTGGAKSREHNQGNQERKYTVEQKAAVIRVRRCQPTAFYEILGLEEVRTTCTEAEIKKAYRKLSLLTHPDKNGYEHADEAFKMVSRAFGVLGDADKKKQYDRHGGDPDSRFGGGAPQQNPFSRGTPSASRGGGGGGGGFGWEQEISPEEMFNRFFGGGGFGGGMFDAGPQFVFNMGGGPGIRVHQFGGARPRRRPRNPNTPEPPTSVMSTIIGLLPLLILFVIPLLQSIFSGASEPTGPLMRFDGPVAPHTYHRLTTRLKVDYWTNKAELEGWSPHKLTQLDRKAELNYIQQLKIGCEEEISARQRLVDEATGWFLQDADKMHQAKTMKLPNCDKLDSMGGARNP